MKFCSMISFALIKTDPGHERAVCRELLDMQGIKDLNLVGGEWDIVAKLTYEPRQTYSTIIQLTGVNKRGSRLLPAGNGFQYS